jgi:hypothetical protein
MTKEIFGKKSRTRHHKCPVCKVSRLIVGVDHGKCIESRAKTDGKEIYGFAPSGSAITQEMHEKSQHRQTTRKMISGKLPAFMFT